MQFIDFARAQGRTKIQTHLHDLDGTLGEILDDLIESGPDVIVFDGCITSPTKLVFAKQIANAYKETREDGLISIYLKQW